jgi:hypothetical protein
MMPASASPASSIHRILCIDGGGILGTLPESFLESLEENLARPIGERCIFPARMPAFHDRTCSGLGSKPTFSLF